MEAQQTSQRHGCKLHILEDCTRTQNDRLSTIIIPIETGAIETEIKLKIESTFEIEIVIKIEIEFEFEFESGIEIDVETHGRSVAERRLTRMTMVARAAPRTASGTRRLTRMSMVAAPRTASGTSPGMGC